MSFKNIVHSFVVASSLATTVIPTQARIAEQPKIWGMSNFSLWKREIQWVKQRVLRFISSKCQKHLKEMDPHYDPHSQKISYCTGPYDHLLQIETPVEIGECIDMKNPYISMCEIQKRNSENDTSMNICMLVDSFSGEILWHIKHKCENVEKREIK